MKIAREMRVEVEDSMGNDMTVVNAARVSFGKRTNVMRSGDKALIAYLATGLRQSERSDLIHEIATCPNADIAKRLYRTIRHQQIHFAPFTHCMMSFRIAAPLFVARHLWKSHIGLANQDEPLGWSEISRRYVDDEPEFYLPYDGFWGRAKDVKQGAAATKVPWSELIARTSFWFADKAYRFALWRGAAPEDARMILPSALMTEWIWTGSILSFARVCHLRQDSHAQSHTRMVANMIDHRITDRFPEAWNALMS